MFESKSIRIVCGLLVGGTIGVLVSAIYFNRIFAPLGLPIDKGLSILFNCFEFGIVGGAILGVICMFLQKPGYSSIFATIGVSAGVFLYSARIQEWLQSNGMASYLAMALWLLLGTGFAFVGSRIGVAKAKTQAK